MEKFKYLLPEESKGVMVRNVPLLRKIESGLRNEFVNNGYLEALMPSFEYVDLYKGLDSDFEEEKCFQYINKEGKSIALCSDLTIPLARYYIAQNKQEEGRYCYFGQVYRKENKHQGKSSELLQAGIELINKGEFKAEQEVIKILNETLKIIELKNLKIELGSASFFKRIYELVGYDKKFKEILNKKDISGMRKFVLEKNFEKIFGEFLIELPRLCIKIDALEEKIKQIKDKELIKSLNELKLIYNEIESKEDIVFDLGMVPSMNYYTGFMFKVYTKYCPEPVISGGRYDSLLQNFGKDIPAIGFAYYLNNILKSIEKSGEDNG